MLAAAREKRRRRLEEKLRYFVPTSPEILNRYGRVTNDQRSFLLSPATERWLFGGNRSGKTEVGVVDCLWFALGIHEVRSLIRKPPVYIRYCAPSYEDNLKRIILKKFRAFVPRHELLGGRFDTAWSEKEKTLYFTNGTTINFKSFEQDVDKFAGDDLDAVYVDEHGAEKYYYENKARLVDRAGYYVNTMTPEGGSITWEKRHIRSRTEDIYTDRFSIYGNPHLSEAGIKEIEDTIVDESLRDVKLEGKFASLSGLLYPNYDQKIHRIPAQELPVKGYRVFAIDPHLKKPSAMLWAYWTAEGDCIIYRSAKVKYEVEDLKRFIRAQSTGERISLWIGDEAQGGAGKNIFGEESVLVQLAKGDNSIPIMGTNQASDKSFESGVMKVRQMLRPDPNTGKPSLMFMEHNTIGSNRERKSLFEEIEDYQFAPESKADEVTFRERVVQVEDDLMDCLRYVVMAGRGSSSGQSVVSGIGSKW